MRMSEKGDVPSSMSSGKNQSPDGFFGWNLGTRHQRSVRKRVSPNRSWNSCSSLCPPRGARWAISPEWGIKRARRRSAHFLLKWPSKTFWLIGPNSLIRDGFQCLHLTSLRSVIGAGMKLFNHLSLSTISHRSCRSTWVRAQASVGELP